MKRKWKIFLIGGSVLATLLIALALWLIRYLPPMPVPDLPVPVAPRRSLSGSDGVVRARQVLDEQENIVRYQIDTGSGVYMGHGIILTNWHVMEHFPEKQYYFQVPSWNTWKNDVVVPITRLIYHNPDLDIAFAEVESSAALNRLKMRPPCLFTGQLGVGDVLTVTSAPASLDYTLVSATLVASDVQPLPRPDPDPHTPEGKRRTVTTVITTLSADQAGLVGYGSSGGGAVNSTGALVGLVWTGRELADGSTEVWITPVSRWFVAIQEAELPAEDLQMLLSLRCN